MMIAYTHYATANKEAVLKGYDPELTAFDAAVSALVMAEHAVELMDLPGDRDPQDVLEGRIWMPRV